MRKLYLLLTLLSALSLSACIINGYVKNENGQGASDVTMTLSGPKSETVTTDATGKFQFDDKHNWLPVGTYTVTPAKDGYRFFPSRRTVTITTRDYNGTDTAWPVNNVDFEAKAEIDGTDPIILGVAGPHSGDLVSYGIPSIRAAELVAEKFNTSGGLLSRIVEVLPKDDECDPDLAATVANEFVADKVNLVLGHNCSDAAGAALPFYTENNIISMSPSASAPELTQSGDNPTFFRTIVHGGRNAELAVSFAVKQLKSDKVAILYETSAYGQGFAEYAKEYLTGYPGVEVLFYEAFGYRDRDFSVPIVKIKQLGVDCVIFAGHHTEASLVIRQMRDLGVKTDVVCSDRVMDDVFIELAGEDAEGVYAIGPKHLTSNPMYVDATEEYNSTYGSEPGSYFYEAYAGALVLCNAVKMANSTGSDDILQVLRSKTFETPLGSISFDDKGDVIGTGSTVYRVKGGMFVEYDY